MPIKDPRPYLAAILPPPANAAPAPKHERQGPAAAPAQLCLRPLVRRRGQREEERGQPGHEHERREPREQPAVCMTVHGGGQSLLARASYNTRQAPHQRQKDAPARVVGPAGVGGAAGGRFLGELVAAVLEVALLCRLAQVVEALLRWCCCCRCGYWAGGVSKRDRWGRPAWMACLWGEMHSDGPRGGGA